MAIKETTKAVDHEDGRQVVPEPAGRGLSEDYTVYSIPRSKNTEYTKQIFMRISLCQYFYFNAPCGIEDII